MLNANATSNSNLASPSHLAKLPPFHHFGAKENNPTSFQVSHGNDEFYDQSQSMGDMSAYNPLLPQQPRDYSFQPPFGMQYREMRPGGNGFQPINYNYGHLPHAGQDNSSYTSQGSGHSSYE